MCIASVPNFCKSFAFGTVLRKNVIALADLFPISCQWKDISVKYPYLQYMLICGTHKMPCGSSIPNHQHLQSAALNSDGSFVCKYCSNCVWLFVPARLFSRLSHWCSVWWCQKNFLAFSTIGQRLRYDWYPTSPGPAIFFFLAFHNRTALGLIGNCLWDVLLNEWQYCNGVVYQYLAIIRLLFRTIFTRQAIIH